MAHKINENCKKNAAIQLVAYLANVYSNRTPTDVTLSIAPKTDNTQKNNREQIYKELDYIKDEIFWETIAGNNVPYIIRWVNGKYLKFVATQMAEYQILKKYLHNINSNMYTLCTPVKAYVITNLEAKILNYINEKHYGHGKDFQFFAGIDYIVCLEDIHNFYIFIEICYKKLLCNITSGHKDKFGFICINSDITSCVPYCTQDDQKYVPLFYFETKTENLIQKTVNLENWNLAYLKFCCKLQGIRGAFFAKESWLVVSLDDIKNFFPPEINFKDFWPARFTNLNLLTNQKSSQTNSPGCWFSAAPEVVPDQNTVPHTLTAPTPIISHSTQVMMSRMQQQQQRITTPQIQALDISNNAAYKIQMATLEGKTIHCINVKPYIYSNLMVTLKDLVLMLLPLCTVAKCAHVLVQYLETMLLFGKIEQLAVLRVNDLIKSMNPGNTNGHVERRHTSVIILKDICVNAR